MGALCPIDGRRTTTPLIRTTAMPEVDDPYEDAVDEIESFRPLFELLLLDWLLKVEEVQALILETRGDVAWLAREFNSHADQIARDVQREGAGLNGSDSWGTRRFVHALKTAAAVLGQGPRGDCGSI
jgi:hypothetical protein